jgi:alginate O-acetyltransferase complex protein AlgI
MTAACVYRPFREAFGQRTALLASFVFSGLLHEAAISLPVHAGYGLPLGYFVLQGVLVACERARSSLAGRVWTLFWLAAPLLLLFHPLFLRGVVFPLVLFSPGGAGSP